MFKEIEFLYKYNAVIYSKTHGKRNFKDEISSIMFNNSTNVLELFSGPLFHGKEILKKNTKVNLWAIDYSSQMKEIALKNINCQFNGFKEKQYIVGNLPNAINKIPTIKFDMIICMLYSIGYLKINEVYSLLKDIKFYLKDSGIIVFELHKISSVIRNFSNTKILKRKFMENGNDIICEWPYKEILWNEKDFTTKMYIRIKFNNKTYKYVSMENIYSYNEIKFLSNLLGYSCKRIPESNKKLIKEAFPDSKILILKKNV